MDRMRLNEEQQRMIREFAALLGVPETRPEHSALENEIIELCVERSDGVSPASDAAKAQQLDKLLKAAAARHDKVDVNVRSTSGVLAVLNKMQPMLCTPWHSTQQQLHAGGLTGGCGSDWTVVLLPLTDDP
jgi:hypothetical protein